MALNVELLHFYPLDNAGEHHTDRYEIVHIEPRTPVLRRGQKFNAALRFQGREFSKGVDNIRIIFSFGSSPHALKGTKNVISLVTENVALEPTKWGGKIVANNNNTLMLELISSVDAPVGPWKIEVECTKVAAKTIYEYEGDFWLLFNPWNKHDLVHMPETKYLDEYVLSDVGKIWVGPHGTARGREWVFGQFDNCILPASVLMLDRANVHHQNRSDPIIMARAISRIVNSNDDRGVLVGRWDGNYKDGTGPSTWTGTVDILEQFLNTEEEVKYGQCWVFAGVVTTVCRALGIPSRVISNLVSAHDSNQSLTIDKYYDKNNTELDYDPNNPMGEDSVWNFHVWNDVYMARPDLPKGYGGWQAIDATPQEKSGGMYQCGPASLEAIRQGEVGMNYDVPFLISSVNADFMKWKEDETSEIGFRRIECNKYHIGKNILTKQPFIFDPNGDKDREDITLQYKAAEGSKDERLSLYNAVRNTSRAKRFYDVPDKTEDDVVFTLVDLERVDIGKPFAVVINIENKSNQVRTIEAILTAASVYYTGIKAKTVKKSAGDVRIRPLSKEEVRMTVKPDEYIDNLVEYCIMKIYAMCTVKETKQMWADEDDFQVIKPNILIKIPKELQVNEMVNAIMTLTNPLDKILTNCQFQISGPGLIQRTIKVPYRNARPGETIRVTAPIRGASPGNYKMVATFTSKELSDVTGSASIEVY